MLCFDESIIFPLYIPAKFVILMIDQSEKERGRLMRMKQTYTFNINGFDIRAVYDDQTVDEIILPLLRKWTALYQTKGRRVIVFLSAPPGTGKTTLSRFIEHLSRCTDGIEPVQALGLDGFHYHQSYILTHDAVVDGKTVPMKSVKGCPETFDREQLAEKLRLMQTQDVMWPVYDRTLHDAVDDVISVTANIVLIEGNWLLFNEGPWADLIGLCDDSIYIGASPEQLAERLIERKMKGGLNRADAEAFYNRSDKRNIERLTEHHHKAETTLVMVEDGVLRHEQGGNVL